MGAITISLGRIKSESYQDDVVDGDLARFAEEVLNYYRIEDVKAHCKHICLVVQSEIRICVEFIIVKDQKQAKEKRHGQYATSQVKRNTKFNM